MATGMNIQITSQQWRRVRPALLIALALAILQLGLGAVAYYQSRNVLIEGRLSAAHSLTQGLVVAVGEEWAQRNYASMEARVLQTMADPVVASVVLQDLQGRVLVRLEREAPNAGSHLVYNAPAFSPPDENDPARWQATDQDRLTTWAPVRLGVTLGWIRVQTFMELDSDEWASLRRQNFWLALLSLISGGVILGVFLWRAYFALVRREHFIEMKLDEASNRLLQSDKLAALGQLAAGVAHEINNPVAYVSANVRALQKYMQAIDQYASDMKARILQSGGHEAEMVALEKQHNIAFIRDDVTQLFNETEQGLGRVSTIVRDLQNFARADVKQEFLSTNLLDCVQSTLNIARAVAKQKVDFDMQWQDLPKVDCVPSQINQVLLNLMVNAVQATDAQRPGRITIRSGTQGERVWVEISDVGHGMSSQTLAKMFDPFFTTKPQGEGTGLGLSVSLGIVQRHGGQLSAVSEEGRGTTVRLELPIHQPKTPHQEHRDDNI
ncbi:MAG: sporulation kinase [Pseudomonadota bacterium]